MTYLETILADDPLGYWPAAEEDGPLRDELNSWTLPRAGGGSVGYRSGLLSTALGGVELAGGAHFGPLPGGPLILLRELTLEAWIRRRPAAAADMALVSRGAGAWLLELSADGALRLRVSDGAAPPDPRDIIASSPPGLIPPEDHGLHHVAVSNDYPPRRASVYLDGVDVSTSNVLPWSFGPGRGFMIGADEGARPFAGTIGHVAVYDHALGLAELRDHYRAGYQSYIGAVVVDGRELDLARVLASVTIRHGRDDPDGPIQSSTATVKLRNIGRYELPGLTVGLALEVRDLAGAAMFSGTLTDSELDDDDPRVDAVLSLIASSTLAMTGNRPVAGHQWPAEPWYSRIARILGEAGVAGGSVIQPPSPDVPMAATKPEDPETGAFAQMGALDALEEARSDIGATIFDQPDGTIVAQAYDGRRNLYPVLALDPAIVLYSPPWTQTLEVRNRIVLGYGYGDGAVTVDDAVSQARYGLRWTGDLETGLGDQAAALERATTWLARLAYPKWALPGVTLLEPQELAIGQMVELDALPASAPFGSWRAVVEGWTDTIEGPDWTQELVLSDPQLSGLTLHWDELPSALLWQELDPAAKWSDAYALDNLVPQEAAAYA